MINVAVLSRWHVHADDYVRDARANGQLNIKMAWDEDTTRGQEWADELGVPFEQDLDTLLKSSEIDAVIVSTPTNLHKEVIIAAANHKKHIFSEKVLAFTVEECKEIYEAVERNDVKLMLSLPRLTHHYYLFAQEALDAGKLGKLTSIRCRLAHNGAVGAEGEKTGWLPERFYNEPETGGGALIDLGAHPIYLSNRLAGKATAVQARLQDTNNLGVDDNSVVLLEYESGALGTLETGFVAAGSPFQLELYGTTGSIMIEDESIRYNFGEGFKEATDTKAIPAPMEQWVNEILHGETPTITKEDVLGLTLINQVAAESHQEGKRIEIK